MTRGAALVLPLLLGITACAENPTAPQQLAPPDAPLFQRPERGTGLALDNVLGGLPLIGNFQVTQVVITEFETVLGGLQASGTISGFRLDAPGITLTDEFTADVLVSSSSSGRCDLVTIDLGPFDANVLGLVQVDIPTANVSGQGSGAVGPILCNIGQLVNAVAGNAVRALVSVLNRLI
jgi:hypothetical protein